MNKRDIAVDLLKKFLGLPYKWGGNDPMEGFDCSGLVIEMLQSVGIMERKADFNADGLSKLYPETELIQPGVLVFYDWNNDGVMDHVEIVAFLDEDGEVFTIGASGGNSATSSQEVAQGQNAYVKVRPLVPGYKIATDPF